MNYYTLVEAKRDHPKWFEPGAMRFFNTQLDREFHAGAKALYLVYSNRFDEESPRRYHVTRFDSDDSTLLGPVEGLETIEDARSIAEQLATLELADAVRMRADRKTRFVPCSACEDRAHPGWGTFEILVEVEQTALAPVLRWADVCSEHIIELKVEVA